MSRCADRASRRARRSLPELPNFDQRVRQPCGCSDPWVGEVGQLLSTSSRPPRRLLPSARIDRRL
eukprot:8201485-Alexandrium_andersonii.AAC.1